VLSKAERNGGLYEQREMFGEGVAGIGPASRFVVLALPGSHPSHYLSIPKRKCCTASREPLHFIVMSVMVVISLYLWDSLHDGELLVYLGTVTSSSWRNSLR